MPQKSISLLLWICTNAAFGMTCTTYSNLVTNQPDNLNKLHKETDKVIVEIKHFHILFSMTIKHMKKRYQINKSTNKDFKSFSYSDEIQPTFNISVWFPLFPRINKVRICYINSHIKPILAKISHYKYIKKYLQHSWYCAAIFPL